MELSPKKEMFVRALIDHKGNATQAYLQIHPQAKYSSARHSASLLLTNVYVKQRFLEILEQNGLGLQEVAKKLSKEMNAQIIRVQSDGSKYAYDNKDVQFKALDFILRLYNLINKVQVVLPLTPEQLDRLVKEQSLNISEETKSFEEG